MMENPQETTGNHRLTSNQRKFLIAYLSSKTIVSACETVGISYETARVWLKLPHIRAVYDEMMSELSKEAFDRLTKLLHKAMDTIERNMTSDETDSTQVRAAQVVLQQATAIQKMAELEKMVSDFEAAHGIENEEL